MEALVERDVARGRRPLAHLVETGEQRLGPLGLEAFGRLGRGQRLERRADLVVLAQVVHVGQEDDRAALRVQPHEPLPLQHRQRLAHRRRAHAERPAISTWRSRLPAGAPPGDDLRACRRSATWPATVGGAASVMARKVDSAAANVQIPGAGIEEELA